MKKNILIVKVVFIAVFLGVLLIAANAAEGVPTMFCNDEVWYDEYRLGYEKIFSQYYIPVSMLKKFDGVEIKVNSRLNTLLISRVNSYISFDIDANYAYTENEGSFYLRTYLLKGGERYIPAEIVCTAVGLTFESSSDGKVIRVKDYNAEKSLDQLMELYSSNEQETTPSDSGDDPSVPQGIKDVYLIFDSAPYNDTSEILILLESYKIKATFFMREENMTANPKSITDILAYGHKICVSPDADYSQSVDGLIERLDSVNLKLYSAAKIKSRIFTISGSLADNKALSAENIGELKKRGFLYCAANIDAMDGNTNYTASQNSARILSLMLIKEIPAIRFSGGENTYGILEKLLEYFSLNSEIYNVKTVDLSGGGLF